MSLIKKIDGYYFRGYIPKNLHKRLGKKTKDRKLHTKNKKEALKIIKQFKIEFDYYILGLGMKLINKNDLIKQIDSYTNKYFKSREEHLFNLPNDDLEKLFKQGYFYDNIEALQEAVSYKNFDLLPYFNDTLAQAIEDNISKLTKSELEELKVYLAEKLLRNEELIRQRVVEGHYYFKIHNENIPQQPEQTLINTIQQIDIKEEIKPIYTLKEKYEEYKEVIGGLRTWSDDTKSKHKNLQKALLLYFKDIDINSITIKDAIKFRDTFKELPIKWVERNEFKNSTSLKDIIKENKKHKIKTLSLSTVNKELSKIKDFYNYCINEGFTTKNPFNGINFKIKKITVNDKQKKQFTEDELDKIFKTYYYTTGFNTFINKGEIAKIIAPILALYSGMRLNELASLYKDDIKKEDKNNEVYYYFDINRKYDKVVKSDSGLRIIPIHNKIIELGFIKYIEQFKEGERIFPKLKKHKLNKNEDEDESQGRYGKDISDWFLNQKKEHFISFLTEPELKSFHSLRHNFTDKLVEQGVNFESIEMLLGHYLEKRLIDLYTEYQFIKEFTNIVNKIEYKAPSLDRIIKKIKDYIN